MGWYLRKSFRIAPGIRLNLSKSGFGTSVGVPGFGVSTGPRGSYVHMGRGGICYRQRIGGPYGSPNTPNRRPYAVPTLTDPETRSIPTASAADLVDSSSAQVLGDLNRQLANRGYAAVTCAIGCAATLLLSLIHIIMVPLVGGFTAYLTWLATRMDNDRRRSTILYDFDDDSVRAWHALTTGIMALQNASNVWRVEGIGQSLNWKRNAGSSYLQRRYPVTVSSAAPPMVDTNVRPCYIDIGYQRLLFMPDRLYVWQGRMYGAVNYSDLHVQWGSTPFIESEHVPSDATIVGQTWQYANKDGGPDRRFSYNRQLPIVSYGLLVLQSSTGLNLLFETSTVEAARLCAEAIRAWSIRLANKAS